MFTIFHLISMLDDQAHPKVNRSLVFIASEWAEISFNASTCLIDSRKIRIFQDLAATMSELRKLVQKVEEPLCTADINKS